MYKTNVEKKNTKTKRFANCRWKIDLSHYYTARRQVFSSLSVRTIPFSTTHSASNDVFVLATLWCSCAIVTLSSFFTHFLLFFLSLNSLISIACVVYIRLCSNLILILDHCITTTKEKFPSKYTCCGHLFIVFIVIFYVFG